MCDFVVFPIISNEVVLNKELFKQMMEEKEDWSLVPFGIGSLLDRCWDDLASNQPSDGKMTYRFVERLID